MDKDKQKPLQFWAKIEPLLIVDILEKSGSILNQDLPLMLPHNPLKGKNPFGKTFTYIGQAELKQDGDFKPSGIGRMIFDADNTILEGKFKGGLADGYARFIGRSGDFYVGLW